MSSCGSLSWTQLELPSPLPVEAARAAVSALAGLSGQPRLVLEARGEAGGVTWFLGAEPAAAGRAVAAMSVHLVGLRVVAGRIPASSTAAVAVRLPGHQRAALTVGATEQVARGVLAGLSGADHGELVRLQVILGPRHRPRLIAGAPSRQRTRDNAKFGEHRFSCEVRIGVRARDRARAQRLVGDVAAPLRGLEAPGVALQLKRSSLRSLDEARDPLWWPSELGVTELTALLGWPIGPKDVELPGVPSPHPRRLPVAARVPRAGRILGDSVLDRDRPVGQGVEEAKRVMHVIGPMGTGKSTMLVNLALADAAAGRSVVLIDGKGDACTDFLERVDPTRHDDIVVVDPADTHPVGVSVFDDGQPERSADVIFGVFKSLYGDQLGPRSSDLLHACLLTLARVGGCSLAMVPMMLSNPAVRRPLVAKVTGADPLGLGAFWAHFEALSDAERTHVIAPLRNKLDPILTLRPSLRAMFGQADPRFALRELFLEPDRRPIVVISLGSAELGPEGARLMGSILLALIWQTAQERTRVPQSQRHPVMLYLDEFQEIVRLGDLVDALGRARGLGVAFAALAHQSLTQLTPSMRQAVMAHARSRVCFQLSPQDAKDIAATTNGALTARDFQELPAFTAQASLLVEGDRMPWCTIRTHPLPPKIQSAAHLRRRSRNRYGRPLGEVEAELLAIGGWTRNTPADESFGRSRRAGGEA
ncbi:type IV secretion system DNA-binding domain-containing protein [Gordonia sihwensis]|uniref:type IV secretion system DNA-binding domain-containing protein n=1 Tax=Gordonia sihwensis TaxID=173559 RepID=UPI0005EF6A12|nr:type IV secretion system DNA-binding domain-containing protein [Gordonia sihwensis]KJR10082.1 hypothetical protein UG54_02120 [Gordonia sihwensis]